MTSLKLNDSFIKNYPQPNKRIEISDSYVQGLAVRISSTGYKSFVYRFKFNGESKRYTLGKYPDISLADARSLAKDLTTKVRKGINPLVEKRRRQQAYKNGKFEKLARKFLSEYLPTLKETTQYNYKIIIKNKLVPELGKYQVDSISKKQIVDFLDKVAFQESSPTYANRIRARLSRVFTFGIERNLVKNNPVQGTPRYKESSRERFYSEEEIKELWSAFETIHEPTQSILKMLLLNGQRKTETMKMRWVDVNLDKNVWTIPKGLAKNNQTHEVYFSSKALDILITLKEDNSDSSEYVFGLNGKPIKIIRSSTEKIRRITSVSDFRPHDLRRTFATYLAKLGTDRTVLGKILNHKGLSGDSGVTAIYDRHSYLSEKRKALQSWSNHLERIINGKKAKITKIA